MAVYSSSPCSDTLCFLWRHHDSPPYLLISWRNSLLDYLMIVHNHCSQLLLLYEVVIGINRSFNMEPATATDVCNGIFKSKNITINGNATIIKQTGTEVDRFGAGYSVPDCVNTYC